jgi:hypothetical protein
MGFLFYPQPCNRVQLALERFQLRSLMTYRLKYPKNLFSDIDLIEKTFSLGDTEGPKA